ncbi:MAG TPA: oligoendopeptidase F, partial [Firmicutes bacterium]|nr:oligoendopeptidase F [Bacillota bacterium]
MELKARKDMDSAYQWDLSPIFENREAWDKAYREAEKAVAKLPELENTLKVSPQQMRAGLDRIYQTMQRVERVYLYASLLKNSDNGDGEYQRMEGMATNLYVAMSTACAFVDPEILSMPEETLLQFLDTADLAPYRHILGDVNRARAHTLDAAGEKMLAMLSDAADTADNCFTMLESVDMEFPKIRDEAGQEVQLTHGNYGIFRVSADQRVRRESFEAYHGTFKKYINTLAAMYAGSVKMDTYYTRVRHYGSACERALFASNVPLQVYDSLVEAVHGAMPAMERYLALRKRVLGLDELNMYDLYCPMVEDIDLKLDYEQAKALVLAAVEPMGEEYCGLIRRAFDERWIDVYENKGKTTGAFSCGVYGVHPYVLLNFSGTLEDAFTLAHELGHSMHSYFSDHAQDYPNHDYRILVAEVASTVNEVLLTKYLLRNELDPKRRAYILNHFLEGFRTTVFRQTLFAEFERRTHDLYQSGEPLTAETLCKVYRELNDLYYAGAVNNELQDVEWARVPHFYTAFYVYQYATGFCSAVAIAAQILESGDASRYLTFLRTGGSMYPIDELKLAGVDLTQPETVRRAL